MIHQPLAVIQLAKTNKYFARAIDTDDYRAAAALREQALERRTNLPAVNPPPEPTSPGELDAWIAALTQVRTAEQDRELQHNALSSVINTCNARIAAVVDVDTDQVLSVLADEMDALLADVDSAVAKLGAARVPSEVIAAAVGDVWNELRTLRKSYDELRAAQVFVMGPEIAHYSSDYLFDDPHCSRLYIRDIDSIFVGWKVPDTSTLNLSAVPQDPRPWPTDDPVAQLVWLSINAELWIPTFEDLRLLERELHRQYNPEPEVIPGRPDQVSWKPQAKPTVATGGTR